jgi:hypothetical protein
MCRSRDEVAFPNLEVEDEVSEPDPNDVPTLITSIKTSSAKLLAYAK